MLSSTELSVKQICSFFLCALKSVKNGRFTHPTLIAGDRHPSASVDAEYRCPQFAEAQIQSFTPRLGDFCLQYAITDISKRDLVVFLTEPGCGMSSPAHPLNGPLSLSLSLADLECEGEGLTEWKGEPL